MKKLVVSIATVGLTMCNSGGAVDPAPQPLMCSNVGDGQDLMAQATINGTKMTVTITTFGAQWKGTPNLSNVTGANVTSITSMSNEVIIVLDFGGGDAGGSDAGSDSGSDSGSGDAGADAGVSFIGSFTLSGDVTDNRTTCPVKRTFHINDTQITQLEDALPLRNHTPATIEVTGKDEREVRLRAGGVRSHDTVMWTVSDGVLAQNEGEVRWILPTKPGLYQVEVLVDRGGEGVALDTLVMEVV